ncbi:hypothetical protein F7734_44370 [Scytonema sp. UIC 10036]|uniref:hypothetical protein n=1 Tax=Scytonema sp. UIC 10036 TaxID=2304196 RepID=UPI0012DA5BAC|nr:hypothetical protein [Scytonema sp. UIC 10036]MUG98960.1 hypothetical protein [Scytonema sp. UIC 10036]
MQLTITIEGKLLGRAKPLFANWCIPLPIELSSDSNHLTLQELLTKIILKDIEAFCTRQEQRRLTHVLTKSQIQQGVELGKVEMGGSDLQYEVDSQAAVDKALQAFEDGLYFVFVDEEQQLDLDGVERQRDPINTDKCWVSFLKRQ